MKEVEFAVKESEFAVKESEFAVKESEFAVKESEFAVTFLGHRISRPTLATICDGFESRFYPEKDDRVEKTQTNE